jgi:hypothetical protein
MRSETGAADSAALSTQAEQLFALANQTRTAHGLGRLEWDPALAAAALKHCQRMSVEGPIAHRYAGELDLTERAGLAGAHFSLIEENIAVGAYPASIHEGWMQSPDHRANLLNNQVDRVGVAVVARGGVIYAVADYAHAVQSMTSPQVDERFAVLLKAHGVQVGSDAARLRSARAYCDSTGKFQGADSPDFMIRWQNPDVSQLPQPLVARLNTGDYKQAVVVSCAPQDVEDGFTVYRVAVLLYSAENSMRMKPYYQP